MPPNPGRTSKREPRPGAANSKANKNNRDDDSGIGGIGVVDLLRVLGGLLLLSTALSYWVTAGDSLLWGWRPWFARGAGLRAWMSGPVLLTDEQLKAYDGSDASKPIYLALNGTIYDVSAGRHFYGPGGGYSFFAGRDAVRAFVTGCFDTDLSPDLRGVEQMYMPVDEEENASSSTSASTTPTPSLTPAQRKIQRQADLRVARKRVAETVNGWARVFAGETGKEYVAVGRVVRPEGWLDDVPVPELCEKARKQRPVRGWDRPRENRKGTLEQAGQAGR
ncbi:hypothetical protein BKA81DRAFT_97437 [Phyllosticta paracitricarpa]|uniref:Cytochrome b5 heme-binding domain-containing protein n=1 Tax=Phyllosticta paracitricarpa TaxID=2016321 RepID=A0ABR1NGP1_9PEZI